MWIDVRATCFARFTDGNVNYIVARSIDRRRFVCFVSLIDKRIVEDWFIFSFSLIQKQNVMNNIFHLLKFIYQLMILVEIYWPENQQLYWMSFQVNRSEKNEKISYEILDTSHRHYDSTIQLPDWIHGQWLSIGTSGINTNTIYINNSQLMIKMSDDQTILHDLKFTRIVPSKRQHERFLRIKAKSLEQW